MYDSYSMSDLNKENYNDLNRFSVTILKGKKLQKGKTTLELLIIHLHLCVLGNFSVFVSELS